MGFAPVAIIGRACLLPDAQSPIELWNNVIEKKDCLINVPDGYWNLALNNLHQLEDKISTLRGGYVLNFNSVFNPEGLFESSENILKQDILSQWLIHVGHSALMDAGVSLKNIKNNAAGVIMGNLSYPTFGLSRYAQSVWLQEENQLSQFRFMSGYPIHTMAKCLGLRGRAYAIDAACASSLYAIKLACDELQSERATLMLAGGINEADDLFLHMGFTALQALSKSGQSRPFHREADGLIPAQGAAVVVLKLLKNALQDKDRIYGVIRGIGLSNDGAQKGFLMPSSQGQVTAMKNAYQQACISPHEISWIEAHATGTHMGDSIELESLKQVFTVSSNKIALGTLKANIGHTITASAAAAVINVLSAFEHHLKPPSKIAKQDTISNSFELLDSAVEWTSKKDRYAAINSFGFGGNNAHLIIQDWKNDKEKVRSTLKKHESLSKENYSDIAVVGIGLRVGNLKHHEKLQEILSASDRDAELLCNDCGFHSKMESINLPIEGIRFPPADLKNTLGQQLIILELVNELSHHFLMTDSQRISAYIGMQTEADIARYSLKWRWGYDKKINIMPKLTSSHVLGCMPNIVTNRLNNQFNFQGPSYSISSEELSGVRSLQVAIMSLQHFESDMAIAGAVDMCCEVVHTQAVKNLFASEKHHPLDAAIVLILKRLEDAQRSKDKIHFILSFPVSKSLPQKNNQLSARFYKRFGYSHAADGLLQMVSHALVDNRSSFNFNANAMEDQHENIVIKKYVNSSSSHQPLKSLHFESKPKLAFVFTGSLTSYPRMGEKLFNQFSTYVDQLGNQHANSILNMRDFSDLSQWEELKTSSFLTQLHAKITLKEWKLQPDACIGYCSGESNALLALGAWRDSAALFRDLEREGFYEHLLTSEFAILKPDSPRRWESYRILVDISILKNILENNIKQGVYITIINTDSDCVISGYPEICKIVLEKLLQIAPHASIKLLPYSMVLHCPEFSPASKLWEKVHYRKTYPVKKTQFYSTATGMPYQLNAEDVASVLTLQASSPVNFPRVIENAWNDGVRIFLEHGPRDLCTQWIHKILGDKPHFALPLDVKTTDPLVQLDFVKSSLMKLGWNVEFPKECYETNN